MSLKVILLNGPSSSGKSTLAIALQAYIQETRNEKYSIVSIDEFLEMTLGKNIYEDDVFEISSQLCEKSLEILKNNQGLIIDHVITSERIFNQITEALSTYGIIFVHVTCPLDELKKREILRNNRCVGSAQASFEYLFPQDNYDLTINTFELTVKECSQEIVKLL